VELELEFEFGVCACVCVCGDGFFACECEWECGVDNEVGVAAEGNVRNGGIVVGIDRRWNENVVKNAINKTNPNLI
jgi:hypothetical protein